MLTLELYRYIILPEALTRTKAVFRSLSGLLLADDVRIASPPCAILTFPQDGIIFGKAFSICFRDAPGLSCLKYPEIAHLSSLPG